MAIMSHRLWNRWCSRRGSCTTEKHSRSETTLEPAMCNLLHEPRSVRKRFFVCTLVQVNPSGNNHIGRSDAFALIGSGLRMIQYFINRAGKGLYASRKKELQKAIEILREKAHNGPKHHKATKGAQS